VVIFKYFSEFIGIVTLCTRLLLVLWFKLVLVRVFVAFDAKLHVLRWKSVNLLASTQMAVITSDWDMASGQSKASHRVVIKAIPLLLIQRLPVVRVVTGSTLASFKDRILGWIMGALMTCLACLGGHFRKLIITSGIWYIAAG
jgi:hypothetical protein